MYILVLQQVAFEFVAHFLYFPIWWYTTGLKRAYRFAKDWFSFGNAYMAPWLWLKNIFVPMFGQTDWQGRLVSFIMRFFNVIVRGIGVLFWLGFTMCLFLIWPLLPAFFVYMFFISI